jgi:hypothetical protein
MTETTEHPEQVPPLLRGFVLWQSSDDVKRDLEVICLTCGEHLCDAEHGDLLEILATAAASHEHHWQALDFYSHSPADLYHTVGIGSWDPATGLAATTEGEQLGQAQTADEAGRLFSDVCDGTVYWEPFETEGARA